MSGTLARAAGTWVALTTMLTKIGIISNAQRVESALTCAKLALSDYPVSFLMDVVCSAYRSFTALEHVRDTVPSILIRQISTAMMVIIDDC